MAQSGLQGPYPFTEKAIIDFVVNSSDRSSASVFALGTRKNKGFLILRVGHVDGDLAEALTKFLGQYDHFRFKFYSSTRLVYEKECLLYHKFRPRDNIEHPVKPRNTRFTCPEPMCVLSG